MLSSREDSKQPPIITNKSGVYTFSDFILTIQNIVKPLQNPPLNPHRVHDYYQAAGDQHDWRERENLIQKANEEYRLIKSAFVVIYNWLLERAGIPPITDSSDLYFIGLFSATLLQDDNSILLIFDDKNNKTGKLIEFLSKNDANFDAQLLSNNTLDRIRPDIANYSLGYTKSILKGFVDAHANFPEKALREQCRSFDNWYRNYYRLSTSTKVLKIKITPLFHNTLFNHLHEYANRCFAVPTNIAQKKLDEAYQETYDTPTIFQQLITHIIQYKIQRLKITSTQLKLLSNNVITVVNNYLSLDNIVSNLNFSPSPPTYFSYYDQYSFKLESGTSYDPTLAVIKNYFNSIVPNSSREHRDHIIIDAVALAHPRFHLDIADVYEQNPNLLGIFQTIVQFQYTSRYLRTVRDLINYNTHQSPSPFLFFKPTSKLNSILVTRITELIDNFLKKIYANGTNKIAELSKIINSLEEIEKQIDWKSHESIIQSLLKEDAKTLLFLVKRELQYAISNFRVEHKRVIESEEKTTQSISEEKIITTIIMPNKPNDNPSVIVFKM